MSENGKSLLETFQVDSKVVELAAVDDLWYFITKNGAWIMGSG